MSWDPFQREVLAELGHVIYRTTTAHVEAISDDLTGADTPTAVAASPESAMLARLARAAALPVDSLPAALRAPAALARLRGDGPAKRALWPSLRALRVRKQ